MVVQHCTSVLAVSLSGWAIDRKLATVAWLTGKELAINLCSDGNVCRAETCSSTAGLPWQPHPLCPSMMPQPVDIRHFITQVLPSQTPIDLNLYHSPLNQPINGCSSFLSPSRSFRVALEQLSRNNPDATKKSTPQGNIHRSHCLAFPSSEDGQGRAAIIPGRPRAKPSLREAPGPRNARHAPRHEKTQR